MWVVTLQFVKCQLYCLSDSLENIILFIAGYVGLHALIGSYHLVISLYPVSRVVAQVNVGNVSLGKVNKYMF